MSEAVLLFSGSFQYGVVNDFLLGIKRAFEKSGYAVYEVNLKGISTNEQLLQQLSSIDFSSLKLVVSINALAVELIDKLPQFSSIPFYTYLVDHPLHLLSRFVGTKARILCVDKEHTNFLSQLGIQAQFWPHAVCDTELSKGSISFNEKQGILFPASFTDEDAHYAEINKVAPNIASRLLDPDVRSVSDVLRMLGFMQPGISPSVQLNDEIVTFLRRCDLYLRGRDRNKLIYDCHLAGIPLTIIGNNWDKTHQYDSHSYMPAVPFNELKNLITNSKFILHHSPGFEQGQHERVVYSLARGTCVLSSKTPYLLESYGSGNGIVFYDSLTELKHLLASVTELDYTQWMSNACTILEPKETWCPRVAML
ncbi:MAG: hypothetical protein CL577_07290 [Alteromonadaceae bacterium]|nr:hypothetical protein [Alteromonadaceae bacterium]|tara:strand:+ start:6931 stop:8028 length:1098 start_codon:yes stop_codon:yes gene_type:complete